MRSEVERKGDMGAVRRDKGRARGREGRRPGGREGRRTLDRR